MIELVVCSAGEGIQAGVVEDGRVTDFLPADTGGLGEVHLGRIVRIDRALDSAIVELGRGQGWMSLGKARRQVPERDLQEGAAIVVQITRPGIPGKGPRVSPQLVVGGRSPRRRTAEPAGRTLPESLRARAAGTSPPALLHAPDRVAEVVREGRRLGAERIVADDHLAQLRVKRVALPDEEFEADHEPGAWREVAEQLEDALEREVPLPGGGSLMIEPTRALTVIDVDGHGRTPLVIDLEAAVEIARQLRLRRIGGIVVVDFVDLERKAERERLHDALRRAFRADPLPVEVVPMTRLGLVQMTRKRVGPSLEEMLTRPCPECRGDGRIMAEGRQA